MASADISCGFELLSPSAQEVSFLFMKRSRTDQEEGRETAFAKDDRCLEALQVREEASDQTFPGAHRFGHPPVLSWLSYRFLLPPTRLLFS